MPDEDEFLKLNHGKIRSAEIAAKLGRTPASVRSRVNYLGLRSSFHRFWTTRELEMLKELYPLIGVKVSQLLNRSRASIYKQARKYEISAKYVTHPNWHQFVAGSRTVAGLKIINKSGQLWLYECHCGNLGASRPGKLIRGTTLSCGCLNVKRIPGPRFEEGRSKHLKYRGKRLSSDDT